ncbi:NAD-dependent epimerase/dehydratase family protein [Thalassospira sp. HF15]|uniref:NAD-dependent epimerase/dehydratase family protein n=1 Tax=Thalassospira sp. HF15 TaxID=2722755 RepID=UPI0014312169|nr:NAD-dependent epimerase/dehydratase family protein [Thalassospira sp. HF15]NIY74756.1 NAD-dependent epimerase/dehydratase family protein [Thalassospira sp. HF15]
MTINIAITGASGFCGSAILEKCQNAKHNILSLQRRAEQNQPVCSVHFDLSRASELKVESLRDIDVVVHAAAVAHNKSKNKNEIFRLNEEATKILFNKCLEAGVKKFIFLSTVGVYGEHSCDRVITINDRENPISRYAHSKYNCEKHLLYHSKTGSIDVSILRLPLTYGRNAPGKFGLLSRLAKTSLPLPFAGTSNTRSMIAVDTVANLALQICEGKIPARGIELIVDSRTYSTRELVESIRLKQGAQKKLFYVPKSLMRFALTAIGHAAAYEQLYEDLEFESTIDVNATGCVDANTAPADYT